MKPITRSFMLSCRQIASGDTNPANLSDNYCGDLSYWVAPNDGLGTMFLPYQWNLTLCVRKDQTQWRNALAAELANRFHGDTSPIDVGFAIHGFANAASVHETSTAELAVGLALAAQRHLDAFAVDTAAGRWNPVFADSLADLSWLPAHGYVLLLERIDGWREADPLAFETLSAIFEDAAARWAGDRVPFWVLLPTRDPPRP